MKTTVTLAFKDEKKTCCTYEEADKKGMFVGLLYVRKSHLPTLFPKEISVTVEVKS